MLQNIIDWFVRLFKLKPKKSKSNQELESMRAANYADTSDLNVTEIVAKRLANTTVSDSAINVEGEGPRAEYIARCMERMKKHLRTATARAFGVGGVVLKPYTAGTEQLVDILDQSRFAVVEQRGELIKKAYFLVDIQQFDNALYARGEYHSLDDNGVYTVETKATKDNREIALASVPESIGWADIPEIIMISGVEKPLFAFIKCPTDNREDIELFSGVPVTYGQDSIIHAIIDLFHEIPDEYKRKKVFVGAAAELFDGKGNLPSDGLYKLFETDGKIGDKSLWEVFSPDIRHTSYFDGLNYYFGLLEKAIGVNKGILTDLDTADATATAIKRSTKDTFALVDAMRDNLKEGLEQLAYAFDVYANAGGFAPQGDWTLNIGWSYDLLEDSQESFDQLRAGVADGGLGVEYETAFVLDIPVEEALKLVPVAQETDDTIGE